MKKVIVTPGLIELGSKEYECNFALGAEAAEIISRAKREGRRVIAVGTTSVRTLESAAAPDGTLTACSGNTEIFIYPGYTFKCVDALITNFHLPESTLIMLVARTQTEGVESRLLHGVETAFDGYEVELLHYTHLVQLQRQVSASVEFYLAHSR